MLIYDGTNDVESAGGAALAKATHGSGNSRVRPSD